MEYRKDTLQEDTTLFTVYYICPPLFYLFLFVSFYVAFIFFFFSFFLRHQRKTLRREENCTRKRFSLISFFERKNLFHLKNHVDDGDEIKIMLRKLFFEYWSFLMRNYMFYIVLKVRRKIIQIILLILIITTKFVTMYTRYYTCFIHN